MLGAIAILSIIVAGLLYILGITKYANRLLIFGVVFAFVVPLLLGSITEISGIANLGGIIFLFLFLGIVYAFINFKKRLDYARQIKRRLLPPTALKRRVDRDQF